MNKICPKCGVNWINGTQRVCSECHEFTLFLSYNKSKAQKNICCKKIKNMLKTTKKK